MRLDGPPIVITPTLTLLNTLTCLAAATQDGIALAGRAGGTSSYVGTITPTTLTASRTWTMPNADGTIALLSDITGGGPHAANHASAGSDPVTLAQSQITNLTTDLGLKATDTLVVHLAGTETITGAKTFNNGLTVSSGTTAMQAATCTTLTTGTALAFDVRLTSDGSYYGIGAYYDGGWKRTTVNQGGAVIRNTAGIFDVQTAPAAAGAAGTALVGMQSRLYTTDAGDIGIPNTTASTSTTTGALVVSGGVGIAKEVVLTASAAGAVYWGPTGTDGSVRCYGNASGAVIFEKRASGSWTEIGRFG